MLGKKNPCRTISRRLRRRYSSLARRNRSISRRFLPVRAHDAHAGQRLLHDRADVRQLRLDLLEPLVNGAAEVLHRERHERQRDERPERQPQRRSPASGRARRRTSAPCSPSTSPTGRSSCGRRSGRWWRATSGRRCGAPGSTTSGSVCRCAKKSFRMSYSMCREAPMMIRRMRNRKTPPTMPMPSSSPP